MVIGTLIGIWCRATSAAGSARLLFRLTEWFLVIPFLPLAIVLATVLGPVAAQHHDRHRRHLLARHGAADPQPRRCRSKARPYLERARALGAGRLAPDDPARAAQRDAAGLRATPRSPWRSRSSSETTLTFLGLGDPTRSRGARCSTTRSQVGAITHRRLVVPRAARRLRRPGRAGVHPGRPGARGRPQPAGCEATPCTAVTRRCWRCATCRRHLPRPARGRCPPSAAST